MNTNWYMRRACLNCFVIVSHATQKQSCENSRLSVKELKDIKESIRSLSADVAEVLRNQKQMQHLIGTIQNLHNELK